ncbi:MAG: hypothetical protein N3B18_00595 [Desulfobacterota bacterium]|nr:hypothetical protein [Thermodesulfobacteriota bacterium]
MDTFSVFVPNLLPKKEPFIPGKRSCKGCGKAIATRLAAKAVLDTFTGTVPPICTDTAASLPFAYSQFETTAVIRTCCEELHERAIQIARQSSTLSQTLSKPVFVVSRRVFKENPLALTDFISQEHSVLCLCLDNEYYLSDDITRTGPQPLIVNEVSHRPSSDDIKRMLQEKNNPLGIYEKRFSYYATACPSYPFDLIEKVRKGLKISGNAFILILTPCPTGWIFPPRLTKQVGYRAIQTAYFPLYETQNGQLRLTQQPQKIAPLYQYLSLQRRFFTFPADAMQYLQDAVVQHYDKLLTLHKRSA